MAKYTPIDSSKKTPATVNLGNGGGSVKKMTEPGDWWNAHSKAEIAQKLIATAAFLRTQNLDRYKKASLYGSLYGNMPVFGSVGVNMMKMAPKNQLPLNRPTMSVVTSIVDTVVARVGQAKPTPKYLTDAGDYTQRSLSKKMNTFIQGEFYQTDAYPKGKRILRDAAIWGTGVIKVLRNADNKVALERRLSTQYLFDYNEAYLGDVRQGYELMLVDRRMLSELFPKCEATIARAGEGILDLSTEATTGSVSDLVLVVEGWRLPSSRKSNDGYHAMACSAGLLLDQSYQRMRMPIAMLHYSDPVVGIWGTGVAERQKGNQSAINQILKTIHESIEIVGVPRVYVEEGSKVSPGSITNQVGVVVPYSGTKPTIETAQCNTPELYEEVQNCINRAYQEEGISQLAASSQKPQGLNSGAALRSYDDIQSDRLSSLQTRYQDFFKDLAYLVIDEAVSIAKEEGSYSTVYPNKDGTKEIDLPEIDKIVDPYVIQCYDTSSLPNDPAGRLESVVERMQAGIYSLQVGRRLLGDPDLEQVDRLENAGEERILKILDEIVEEGKFTPPDPFMDPDLAQKLVTQYINFYLPAKLELERADSLRDFFVQAGALKMAAMPPMPAPGMSPPQAVPTATPQSPLLPNTPNPGGM